MLRYRKAEISDADMVFDWVNDPLVRSSSFSTDSIEKDEHMKWFANQISSDTVLYLLFLNETIPVGQVRINIISENEAIIGVLVNKGNRGKGYSPQMIKKASSVFLGANAGYTIKAFIKVENIASMKVFSEAGFIFREQVLYNGYTANMLTYGN